MGLGEIDEAEFTARLTTATNSRRTALEALEAAELAFNKALQGAQDDAEVEAADANGTYQRSAFTAISGAPVMAEQGQPQNGAGQLVDGTGQVVRQGGFVAAREAVYRQFSLDESAAHHDLLHALATLDFGDGATGSVDGYFTTAADSFSAAIGALPSAIAALTGLDPGDQQQMVNYADYEADLTAAEAAQVRAVSAARADEEFSVIGAQRDFEIDEALEIEQLYTQLAAHHADYRISLADNQSASAKALRDSNQGLMGGDQFPTLSLQSIQASSSASLLAVSAPGRSLGDLLGRSGAAQPLRPRRDGQTSGTAAKRAGSGGDKPSYPPDSVTRFIGSRADRRGEWYRNATNYNEQQQQALRDARRFVSLFNRVKTNQAFINRLQKTMETGFIGQGRNRSKIDKAAYAKRVQDISVINKNLLQEMEGLFKNLEEQHTATEFEEFRYFDHALEIHDVLAGGKGALGAIQRAKQEQEIYDPNQRDPMNGELVTLQDFLAVYFIAKSVAQATASSGVKAGAKTALREGVAVVVEAETNIPVDVIDFAKILSRPGRAASLLDDAPGLHSAGRLVDNAPNRAVGRPSARQSELDVSGLNPSHRPQVSFSNGREVPYGSRGSVRPDNFRVGESLEVKNYDLLQPSNRADLYNTIHKQYLQRISNLPKGTHQRIVIDIRGQNVPESILMRVRSNILTITRTPNVTVEFLR